MLCHICREPAIGQCQNCNLFYCAEHGRVYCVSCDDRAVARRPPARPPAVVSRSEGRGATCYHCGRPAERGCLRCGRFFCPDHSDLTTTQRMCGRCASRRFWTTVGVAVVLATGALVLLFLLQP
ncbi:MAG: hypothetical protein IT429_10070 [Gemmataceae bacterium]|nr:hypothetical protein [Gemmataceae bacterium]